MEKNEFAEPTDMRNASQTMPIQVGNVPLKIVRDVWEAQGESNWSPFFKVYPLKKFQVCLGFEKGIRG